MMTTHLRWRRNAGLILLLSTVAAGEAAAGSVEVVLRDRDGEPIRGERVFLNAVSAQPQDPGSAILRRLRHLAGQASGGATRFEGLPPGTYSVDFSTGLRDPTLVLPADNPFVAAPQLTLFDEDEHLRIEVELWRGIPVTAYLDLPENRYAGFRAVFEHRATGRVLTSAFREHTPSIERLLVPAQWEVRVEPKPGYLLVGLDREREPLPGSQATVDLIREPRPTWFTWTYVAQCELFGTIVEETGRAPAVHIEAELIEPGPWIHAAHERGGSSYKEVVAAVDQHSGRYEAVLPEGRWRVRPMGSLLLESEPEQVELELAEGAVGRADFTIRLEADDEESLSVAVFDAEKRGVAEATVEVHDLGDPEAPPRTAVTNRRGRARVPGVPEGDYLVVAGHPEHLEGSVEMLEYDPRRRSLALINLPAGGEVRVQAFDTAGEPLSDVQVMVEWLDEPPALRLQSTDVLDAKRERTLTTDPSGRVVASGFYQGTYRARAQLRGRDGYRSLMRLEVAGGGGAGADVDFEIVESVDLEARMRPAASLAATLQCSDDWTLPQTADLRVVAAGADLESQDDGDGVLALDDVLLSGAVRDVVTAGPLAPGVYRLAVRPDGFDRWTWAFETDDPTEAVDLQVEAVSDDVDLGLFHIECGPAVDLLPEIAGGAPFPDLDKVEIEVRLFDPETGEEWRPPTVLVHEDRYQLRDVPSPASRSTTAKPKRLEISLVHPHLLPAPVQRWQMDFELERGSYEEIVLQVEALGGAITVTGEGAVGRLVGPGEGVQEASFNDGEVEFPSQVPGLYRLQVEDASGEVVRVWDALDVQAGQTHELVLDEGTGRPPREPSPPDPPPGAPSPAHPHTLSGEGEIRAGLNLACFFVPIGT